VKEVRQAALFEKSAQKLFLIWTVLVKPPLAHINKSFLVLFFKKEPLSALYFNLNTEGA
jgi:hypothetical protein